MFLRPYPTRCRQKSRFQFVRRNSNSRSEINVYLNVPFLQKDLAKNKGAKFDFVLKKWFVPKGQESNFQEWIQTWLKVPFDKIEFVKNKGAKWNYSKKSWFVQGKLDPDLKCFVASDSQKYEALTPTTQAPITQALDNHYKKLSSENSKLESRRDGTASPLVSNSKPPILIFDVETTGFANSKNADFKDLLAFSTCRIVQISFLLCDQQTFKPIEPIQDFVVRAQGFDILNADIHGITPKRSMEEGIPMEDLLKKIRPIFSRSKILIAHNAKFDMNALKSEIWRAKDIKFLKEIEKIDVFCSMETLTSLVDAKNKYGATKYPSLKDLFNFSTQREITNQHNSKFDVLNLHEALFNLHEKSIFHLPFLPER